MLGGLISRLFQSTSPDSQLLSPDLPEPGMPSPETFRSPDVAPFTSFRNSLSGQYVSSADLPSELRKRLRFSQVRGSVACRESSFSSPPLWKRLSLETDRCSMGSTLGQEVADFDPRRETAQRRAVQKLREEVRDNNPTDSQRPNDYPLMDVPLQRLWDLRSINETSGDLPRKRLRTDEDVSVSHQGDGTLMPYEPPLSLPMPPLSAADKRALERLRSRDFFCSGFDTARKIQRFSIATDISEGCHKTENLSLSGFSPIENLPSKSAIMSIAASPESAPSALGQTISTAASNTFASGDFSRRRRR